MVAPRWWRPGIQRRGPLNLEKIRNHPVVFDVAYSEAPWKTQFNNHEQLSMQCGDRLFLCEVRAAP